jgi:DNA-binding transcriptional LysR family regulator
VSSAFGQTAAVRSGAGIGILHSFMAKEFEDLVALPIAPPIRRAYWLVYHESVRPLRRIQAVSSFIAGLLEKDRAMFA